MDGPRPEHYEDALRAGVQPARQTLIPYASPIPRQPRILSTEERTTLRKKLRLSPQKLIVLSVGMLSSTHKRMDYLIQEIRALPEPRPYLVMLGQAAGFETEKIKALAERLLGPEQYCISSVSTEQVQDYYWSADIFALASLTEGLARVFLEALAAGLPCISHDYATTRYVLGENGYLGDLRKPGALAMKVVEAIQERNDPNLCAARHRDAYERFSWDRLAPQYAAMLRRVAQEDTF